MSQTTILQRYLSNRKTSNLSDSAIPILWRADSDREPAATTFGDMINDMAGQLAASLFGVGVQLATTANLASLSGEQTIDGVLTSVSKVLVKDQASPADNGLYTTGGGAWTRHADMDTWSEAVGRLLIVESGTANADTVWLCTANSGGVLGTTPLNFIVAFGANIWQPLHARLTAIKNLAWTAGGLIKTTGSTTAAMIPYEEGPWTPAYGTTGTGFTSVTHDVQIGWYQKIGNTVHIGGMIRTDAVTVGSATGGVVIEGLPFTVASLGRAACTLGSVLAFTTAPSRADFSSTSTTIALYEQTAVNGNADVLDPADLAAGANSNSLLFNGSYQV